jgi:hypothetical protein
MDFPFCEATILAALHTDDSLESFHNFFLLQRQSRSQHAFAWCTHHFATLENPEAREWALSVFDKHLGEAVGCVPLTLYEPLYTLLFQTFFDLPGISDKMAARIFQLQVRLSFLFYPAIDPFFFDLNQPLLKSPDLNLLNFFKAFNDFMIGGMTFSVIAFDLAAVKTAMLGDRSQEHIVTEIQSRSQQDDSFLEVYSGLLRWIDLNVLLSGGAVENLNALLSSEPHRVFGFTLLEDLCYDLRISLPDRCARFFALTDLGNLVTEHASCFPVHALFSVLDIQSQTDFSVFMPVVIASISQSLDVSDWVVIRNWASHGVGFDKAQFLNAAHDHISSALEVPSLPLPAPALGAVFFLLQAVDVNCLDFVRSLEPLADSERTKRLLLALAAIGQERDACPFDVFAFFLEEIMPCPTAPIEVLTALLHALAVALRQANRGNPKWDQVFWDNLLALAASVYEGNPLDDDIVVSLAAILLELSKHCSLKQAEFGKSPAAQFIAGLFVLHIPPIVHSARRFARRLPSDTPWSDIFQHYQQITEWDCDLVRQVIGLLAWVPSTPAAWQFAHFIADVCTNADDEALYEPFLRAACRTFRDEALVKWYSPDVKVSDKAILVTMCGYCKGARLGEVGWPRMEAVKYGRGHMPYDRFDNLRCNPTANQLVYDGTLARVLDPDVSEETLKTFTYELIRRAAELLCHEKCDAIIDDITGRMAAVIESIKAQNPQVYQLLFTFVLPAPACFAKLFMDSFRAELNAVVNRVFNPYTPSDSSFWRRLFKFHRWCWETWGEEVPVFPYQNDERVQKIKKIWKKGLSLSHGCEDSIATELDRAARGK